MDEHKLAMGSYELARKDMGLAEPLDLEGVDQPLDRLHEFLTKRIQYLLDHDFGHLINAMYRVDIPENQVKEVLEMAEPGQIAAQLASVVISREQSKVLSRAKYAR